MEQEITYKKCSKCGEEKPATLEYFHSHKRKKYGLSPACKVCKNAYTAEYYRKNRDKRRLYARKNYDDNIERYKKYNRDFYQKNKKNEVKRVMDYIYDKLENDELYKISHNVKTLLRTGFTRKSWGKKTKTQNYLKCNWETFKEHIEKQFTDGMTWDNHGEWHYDHYYPISLAQTEEDMYIFNHYTNFQPLWAEDNLNKKDKVPDGFEEWYEIMRKKVL